MCATKLRGYCVFLCFCGLKDHLKIFCSVFSFQCLEKSFFLQLPLFILQIDASASEKHRLEEKQRAVKKQRELSGEAWTPRYSRFSHTSIRNCSSDSEFIVASETEFQLSR